MSALYVLVRLAVMHGAGVENGEHTWAEVIFSAPSIFLFYMKKLFFPWNLAGSYVNPLTSAPTAGFWLPLLAVGLLLGATSWFAIRFRSLVGLAAALIVIPIVPALAVIRIYPQGDMTHDRYLYVSTIGVALLAAIVVKRMWSLDKPAKIAVSAIALALVVASSIETISLQRYYHDDIAFCHRVLEISPSDAYAHGMFGNIYLDEHRVDLALEEFQEANRIEPGSGKIALFLARGLFAAGRYHESEDVLKRLLQTNLSARRRNSTLLSLANVEIALGKLDYAQQLLEQVEQSDGNFPELHWALGVLYQKQGRLQQALEAYEKEAEITGDALSQQRSAQVARLIYAQSAGSAPRR
jgi:tetratricopeptide (TPR) repeat protein